MTINVCVDYFRTKRSELGQIEVKWLENAALVLSSS